MQSNESISLRPIQTAPPRRERANENGIIVSLTEAIRAAGLESGGSFRFVPGAVEDLEMLPALGSDESVDGRSHPYRRNIRREGTHQSTLRLVIPQQAFATLLDPDSIDWADPPLLNVWAGDQLLAFEVADKRSVDVDRDAIDRTATERSEDL